MSFKRDGDDFAVVNSLQRRRVAELISEDIPPHEAHLMKNGLLACMVCHHRPVFDTLLVLQQHRQGKKHAYYHEQNLQQERELFELKEKRHQEEDVRTGETGSLPGTSVKHLGEARSKRILPTSKNYDSRRKKLQRHHRKPILDLSEVTAHQAAPGDLSTSHHVNTHNHQGLATCKSNATQKRCCQHKNVKMSRTINSERQSCDRKPQTISEYRTMEVHSNKACTIEIKPYTRQRGLHPVLHTGPCGMATPHTSSLPRPRTDRTTDNTADKRADKRAVKRSDKRADKRADRSRTKAQKGCLMSDARRESLEKHLLATSSGWKKDFRTGLWVKDDQAEFDSDEEPPQLP